MSQKLSPIELVQMASTIEDDHEFDHTPTRSLLTLPNRLVEMRDDPGNTVITHDDNQTIELVNSLVNLFLPILFAKLSKPKKPRK